MDRRRKQNRQRGQGMTEYVIIVGVIAVALLAAFGGFGQRIKAEVEGSGGITGNIENSWSKNNSGGGGGDPLTEENENEPDTN